MATGNDKASLSIVHEDRIARHNNTDKDQSDSARQDGEITTSAHLSADTESAKSKEDDSENTAQSFWSLPKQTKYLVFLCSAANFVSCLSYAVPVAFYTKEAEKKGMNGIMVGFVFSVYELVIVITSPLFGRYVTRLGPRFLLFCGIFVCGVSSLIFGALGKCPDEYFELLSVLTRAMVALGYSAFITAGQVIILGEMKGLEATAFSFMTSTQGAGFMVGPVVGGVLFEAGGFGLPFYSIGAVVLFCGLLFYWVLPEIKDPAKMESPSVCQYLRHPMSILCLFCIMTTSTGWGFMDPTLAAHVSHFGLSSSVISLFFLLNSVAYSFTTPIWGCLSDRKTIGQGPILVVGFIIAGVGFLLIGPSIWLLSFIPSNIPVILVGLALMGFAAGNGTVSTLKCLTMAATELGLEDNMSTFGMISGLYNAFFSMGAGIGPIVGGWLVNFYGFSTGTTVIACHQFVMALFCLIYFTLRYFNTRQRDPAFKKLRSGSDKDDTAPTYGSITQPNTESNTDPLYL